MKRAVTAALAAMAVVVGAAAGARLTAQAAEPIPPRVVLVGDSITVQYGPEFASAWGGETTVLGGSGQDPATSPWEAALRADVAQRGAPGVIVVEDWSIPGLCPTCGPATTAEWRTAMVGLVDYAVSTGARVVVLVPAPTAATLLMLGEDVAFLRGLPAEIVAMVPADAPDGLHYTPAGGGGMASALVDQLAAR
ncbi:MAG TPA: hypothetical protein VF244_10495 [Acidimicrobiales bacterium]